MVYNYADITAYRSPFPVVPPASQALLGHAQHDLPVQIQADVPVRRGSPIVKALAGTMGLIGLGGGIALEVVNSKHFGSNKQIGTVADLIIGISVAALAQISPFQRVKVAIFNEIKRWCVPLFEIGTNVYLNVPQTPLANRLYFTPVNIATGMLTSDDIFLLASMKEGNRQLGESPLPMLEGDAKSFKRMALNQAAIVAAGIAMIILGVYYPGSTARGNFRDLGIAACSYTLGCAAAQRLWAQAESVGREWESRRTQDPLSEIPQPKSLRLLNGALQFFQMACPQLFAISIVSDLPLGFGYGLSAFLWGAANQITRTNFQYTVRKQEEPAPPTSLWGRIKSVWNRRKRDLVLTGAFGGVLTGWLAFGDTVAGIARVREGIGAIYGSTVAGFLATAAIDLLWKPSDSSWKNSLFYNTVALSPAAFSYLFVQTKLVANDVFLENSSAFGFTCGIAALSALGLAIAHARWKQTREGRTDPALTDPLGLALLSYETALRIRR